MPGKKYVCCKGTLISSVSIEIFLSHHQLLLRLLINTDFIFIVKSLSFEISSQLHVSLCLCVCVHVCVCVGLSVRQEVEARCCYFTDLHLIFWDMVPLKLEFADLSPLGVPASSRNLGFNLRSMEITNASLRGCWVQTGHGCTGAFHRVSPAALYWFLNELKCECPFFSFCCSPGCPLTPCVGEDHLELLIHLSLPPKCWDCRLVRHTWLWSSNFLLPGC